LVYTPHFRPHRIRRAQNWSPNDREVRAFAHLCAIAAGPSRGLLQLGGDLTPITIDMPTIDPMRVPVRLHDPAIPLAAGQLVTLRYQWRDDVFHLNTRVAGPAVDGRLPLRLPREITPSHHRLFHRARCSSRWRVIGKGLRADGGEIELPVYDISASGIGVVMSPTLARRMKRKIISGVLLRPDALPSPVRFHLTSVRMMAPPEPAADDDHAPIVLQALAAGPFKGLGLLHHRRLAREIARTLDADSAPQEVAG